VFTLRPGGRYEPTRRKGLLRGKDWEVRDGGTLRVVRKVFGPDGKSTLQDWEEDKRFEGRATSVPAPPECLSPRLPLIPPPLPSATNVLESTRQRESPSTESKTLPTMFFRAALPPLPVASSPDIRGGRRA
jgi:hypothetical protein